MRGLVLLVLLLGTLVLSGCPSDGPVPDEPDAQARDAAAPADAGVADAAPAEDAGFRLRALNLTPAGGSIGGSSELSGGLRATAGGATSDRYKLRARIVPLSP